MLIQAGDSEVLRDEITLLAHKATLAGVDVTHELYEDMVHVFQMFTWLPAAKVAINSVGRWVRTVLPRIEEERSKRAAKSVGDGIDGEMDSPVSRTIREKRSMLNRTVGRANGFSNPRQKLSDQKRRVSAFNSLQLDINGSHPDQPSVDIDSLPASGSRSGSPTPTGSPLLAVHDPFSNFPGQVPAPQLRRALTIAAVSTSTDNSPINSPPPSTHLRPRQRTQGAGSLHASTPSTSTTPSNPSNPVSPSPSIRMRLRSPTVSGTIHPTTRHRSESHSDISNLVEGYVEGGAANETVVYAPGGEIRSVGILGEDEE